MPTPEEIAAQEAADAAANLATAEAAKKKDPLDAMNEYLASLPEDERTKLEGLTGNLRSALVSERGLGKDAKAAAAELATIKAKQAADALKEKSEIEQEKIKVQAAVDEAAKLKTQLNNERIKGAVLAAAAKANFADPEDAYAFVNRDALEIDDDGKVKGVEDAVKVVAKAKPHLILAPDNPKFNLNSGDKGKVPPRASVEEIKKKKRAQQGRYTGT